MNSQTFVIQTFMAWPVFLALVKYENDVASLSVRAIAGMVAFCENKFQPMNTAISRSTYHESAKGSSPRGLWNSTPLDGVTNCQKGEDEHLIVFDA